MQNLRRLVFHCMTINLAVRNIVFWIHREAILSPFVNISTLQASSCSSKLFFRPDSVIWNLISVRQFDSLSLTFTPAEEEEESSVLGVLLVTLSAEVRWLIHGSSQIKVVIRQTVPHPKSYHSYHDLDPHQGSWNCLKKPFMQQKLLAREKGENEQVEDTTQHRRCETSWWAGTMYTRIFVMQWNKTSFYNLLFTYFLL